MNKTFYFRKLLILACTALGVMLSTFNAYADPEAIADSPLFTGTAVEPNVIWLLDDSYSMHWETMMGSDVENNGDAGLTVKNGDPMLFTTRRNNGDLKSNRARYFTPSWISTNNTDNPGRANTTKEDERYREVIPPPFTELPVGNITQQHDGMWAIRYHGANKVYYNPAVEYTPWVGIDVDGNALYPQADPKAVKRNPDDPASLTTDLTELITYEDSAYCNCDIEYYLATYYTWNDRNNDGEIDMDEEGERYTIPHDTVFPSGRTQAQELQNYANWLQYYRSRYKAAKASLGIVIDKQINMRMGLDLYLKETQTIRDESNNDVYLATMSEPSNKTQQLQNLYQAPYDWQTPTRQSLLRVGNLFLNPPNTNLDPILPIDQGGACQQNFAVVVTDGYWTGNLNDIDIGNTDADDGADSIFDGGSYADTHNNTLADVAMHFYETDLRSFPDIVPTTEGVDSNSQQHLVTYSVAFGLNGSLDTAISPTAPNFAGWPEPTGGQIFKVDDLWHAAYNGRGQYLSAQNPAELASSLNSALDDIDSRSAMSAAASVTSAELTTDSLVFLSQFNTDGWQGTILAYNVEDLENGGTLSDDPAWSAADILETRDLGANQVNRMVITYDHQAASPGGIPFNWDNINTTMKQDLQTNPDGSAGDVSDGQDRLAWLRGDRSNEATVLFPGRPLRERKSLIGDIVHSGPVYVEKSSLNWPTESPFPTGTSSYDNYKESQLDANGESIRQGMIYVGSNDGMIHGFDVDGNEKLAYIPSNLFSSNTGEGLHYLTEKDYRHIYYNDLTPIVSDVFYNSDWHTILVAGQRGGGKGYSAIDITDPTLFSETNADRIALWEFNSSHDADLGYTFNGPQIGMTNDNEWSIVFGNGYNNSGDGKAYLYILKISKGLDGEWTQNSDFIKIQAGTAGSVSNPNGLSTPSLADLDGNGTIDRAYAGDLRGNLWVFDLTANSNSSWTLAKSSNPLFSTDGLPITSKPALSLHPTENTDTTTTPNIMVVFGSGQYIHKSDISPNPTRNNRFYGVWDKDSNVNLDSDDLVEQTYVTTNPRVLTKNDVDYQNFNGWFISLPDTNERVISNPTIRSGYVFFNSAVPNDDSCSAGGYGYRFTLDLRNGGTPDKPIIDINNDGVIDENDKVDGEVTAAMIIEGRIPPEDTLTEGHIINEKDLISIQTAPEREVGRISWQELLK